jgi:glycosyltransferase involved in cell wall biosynthesis
MHDLAVVIPAYKPDFFLEALSSVAAQTDKRFHVYVGNDGGPREIEDVCRSIEGIELTYHHFPENLGGRSLAGQWNRCVGLSSEPWVWLFADDDVMGSDCVESFYKQVDTLGEIDVARFNTEVIDAEGVVLSRNPSHPALEDGSAFIWSRLMGARNSYAVEYVFRREAFVRAGGFTDYPVAWCADDIAWFDFSRRGGIRTLDQGTVQWRASGLNITDANDLHQREKLSAGLRFLRFVRDEVQPSGEQDPGGADWDGAIQRWFLDQVRYLMPLGPALSLKVVRESDGVWRAPKATRAIIVMVWSIRAHLRRALRRMSRRLSDR